MRIVAPMFLFPLATKKGLIAIFFAHWADSVKINVGTKVWVTPVLLSFWMTGEKEDKRT